MGVRYIKLTKFIIWNTGQNRKVIMQRFFYDIDKEKLYNCFNASHVNYYHNAKLGKSFDDYIRLILANEVLYIRVFYPYSDNANLSYNQLIKKSGQLINLFKKDIIKTLNENGFYFARIKINVTNEDLRQELKTNFV